MSRGEQPECHSAAPRVDRERPTRRRVASPIQSCRADPPQEPAVFAGTAARLARNLFRPAFVSGEQAYQRCNPNNMRTPSRFSRLLAVTICAALWGGVTGRAGRPGSGASDLDAFMAQVLARRDENWSKLQQYVLDERERAEVIGPAHTRLYGLDREYTWYIRDGAFVRSPVRFDGVTLSETERQEYERRWIERERQREARRPARDPGATAPSQGTEPSDTDVDALLKLTREPQFVSSAYFLRFKFEPGRYALVGREPFEGRTVLRIEYYPQRLFADDESAPDAGRSDRKEQDEEARVERQMNKVALVTLWVEPGSHQIVKYTFENVGFDFLPGRSVVRVEDVRASMQMGEPFPGVWLPRAIDGHAAFTLANGTYAIKYDLAYLNYRQADVKVKLR